MTITTASEAYFASVAEEWDTLRAGYFGEWVREAAIARAYLRPEMAVADVGSGTGFMAAGLAPLVSRVYALDGSPAMLEVARRNLAAFDNVEFRVADGASLPLEDGSVDAVFANMYLHHCPDPLAAIHEMARILRPGGRLVITDIDTHTHTWMRAEMADEWLGFERDQVRGWLRAAGLVNVLADCTGQSCCATSQGTTAGSPAGDGESVGEPPTAQISIFVAAGTRRVTGARDAVRASYGAAAERSESCCPTVPPAPAETAATESCCSSGSTDSEIVLLDPLYLSEGMQGIPAEAASFSLGCGNPTALASLQPGEVVLDIGSGGGLDALIAAQRVGPSGRVIGLDMTPAMVKRARRAAVTAGLENVEFRLGQAEAMPVEDGTFDVILSNCVINLCEDKGRVFEEAYRILREGGRLTISDVVTDGPLPLDLHGDPARWADCVHSALPEREYVDLIRAAGFRDIQATRSGAASTVEGVRAYSLAVTAQK